MKRYIPIQVARGDASRQAHTGLPEGTFELEMSKEGFLAQRLISIINVRQPGGVTGKGHCGRVRLIWHV